MGKGARIVDLGCSPGSWLQYLSTAVGESGVVLGYDIVAPKVTGGPNVHTFVTDVHELTPARIRADLAAALSYDPERPPPVQDKLHIHGLLSDMAPKTTGIRDADQARSIGLVEAALELATVLLLPTGCFLAKVFQGRGFDELLLEVRRRFHETKVLRPQATREGSREAFIIAQKPKRA